MFVTRTNKSAALTTLLSTGEANIHTIKLNLSYIESERAFRLEIANVSPTSVRIWSTTFSLGYDSIYFRVSARNGNTCFIRRKPARWTVNIPDFTLILPNDVCVQEFKLNDGTWDVRKCSVDPQTEVDIGALLEIVPDENTSTYGIATGRFESNSLHFRCIRELIN